MKNISCTLHISCSFNYFDCCLSFIRPFDGLTQNIGASKTKEIQGGKIKQLFSTATGRWSGPNLIA